MGDRKAGGWDPLKVGSLRCLMVDTKTLSFQLEHLQVASSCDPSFPAAWCLGSRRECLERERERREREREREGEGEKTGHTPQIEAISPFVT